MNCFWILSALFHFPLILYFDLNIKITVLIFLHETRNMKKQIQRSAGQKWKKHENIKKKVTKMLRILKIRKKFLLFFLLYYSIKRNEENAREMTSNFYDWLIFYFSNIWEPEDKKNRNLDSYFVISATYINPESYEVVLMLICSEQFQD